MQGPPSASGFPPGAWRDCYITYTRGEIYTPRATCPAGEMHLHLVPLLVHPPLFLDGSQGLGFTL